MKVLTDTMGHFVIRRSEHFEIIARRHDIRIEGCNLTSAEAVEEFTEALAGAARDASRLSGKPRYKPATTRRPKEGWPIAMEVKAT